VTVVVFKAKPSRRALLSGLGAALIVGQARADDVDVVVVGAGAAGIAAARALAARRKTFVIIEAADRVGGRMFTNTQLGVKFEQGANFIHFGDVNPLTSLARRLGVQTIPDEDLFNDALFFERGERLGGTFRKARSEAFERLDDLYARHGPRNDVSLSDAFSRGDAMTKRIGSFVSIMATGEDAHRVSTFDYHRQADGVDHRIPEGHSELVGRLLNGIAVRTGVTATTIDWSGSGVRVATNQGVIAAKTVIITVSIGVLLSGRITFKPELPASHSDAIDRLRMGALSKVALRFRPNARFGFKPHQFLVDMTDPNQALTFEAFPFGRDIVTGNFGGDYARDLAKRDPQEAMRVILDRFVQIAGGAAREAFVEGTFASFLTDPLHLGGYAVALPGGAAARTVLQQPVGNRLFFAGEALSDIYAMTTGGAYRSGRSAVRRAIAALN
jgi:monoamine oxidase